MSMNEILKAALFTPTRRGWGLPLLAWGAPGTAKSNIIEELARRWGMPCEVLSPGERGEGAFGCVPVPEEGMIAYPAPDWTSKFCKAGRGLVFVDELTTAAPALQPPMLGLVLEKRIGGTSLPGGVRMLAAANPVEEAAAGYDLPPPLANRLGHITWDPGGVDEWTDWLMAVGETASDSTSDAEAEEHRVEAAWAGAFSRAKGTTAAFVRRRPELLHKMPKVGDPAIGRAWPSRRSWEFATRALASVQVHGLDDTHRDEFLAAFVGSGAAGELATFLADLDLPDPADLLDGKVKFQHDARRLDRTFAVLTSCAALVTPTGAAKRKDRAAAMWDILAPITESAADVTVPSARAMVRSGLIESKAARSCLQKLSPVLSAAGVGSR